MKILLVEDNGYTRETIKKGLLSDGIASRQEIFEAFNGLEGVNLYKKELPDIVIMDINMPELNGYEACMQILDVNPNAYVIFVSGDKSPDAHDHALRVGGIKFLSKPVQTNKINSLIQSLKIKPPEIKESVLSQEEEEVFFLEEPTGNFELIASEYPLLSDDDFGQPIITPEETDAFEFEVPIIPTSVDEVVINKEYIEDDFFDSEEHMSSNNTIAEIKHGNDDVDDFFVGLDPDGNDDVDNSRLTSLPEIKQGSLLQTVPEDVMLEENTTIKPSIEEDFFETDFKFETIQKNKISIPEPDEPTPSISKEDDELEEFFFDTGEALENKNDVSFEFESPLTSNKVDATTKNSLSIAPEEVLAFEDDEEGFSFKNEKLDLSQETIVPPSESLTTHIEDEDEDEEFDLGEEVFDIEEGFDLGEEGFAVEEDDVSSENTHIDAKHSAFHNPAQRKQTIIKRVPLSESTKEQLSKSEHHVVYQKDIENAKPVNIKPPRTNLLASDNSLPLAEPIMNPSNDIIIDNTEKTSSKQGIFDKVKSLFLSKKD